MKKTVLVMLTMLLAFSLLVVVSCKPEPDVQKKNSRDDDILLDIDPATFVVPVGTYDTTYEQSYVRDWGEKGKETSSMIMGGIVEVVGTEADSLITFTIKKYTNVSRYENKEYYEKQKADALSKDSSVRCDDKNLILSTDTEDEKMLSSLQAKMKDLTYGSFIGQILTDPSATGMQSADKKTLVLRKEGVIGNKDGWEIMTLQRRQ